MTDPPREDSPVLIGIGLPVRAYGMTGWVRAVQRNIAEQDSYGISDRIVVRAGVEDSDFEEDGRGLPGQAVPLEIGSRLLLWGGEYVVRRVWAEVDEKAESSGNPVAFPGRMEIHAWACDWRSPESVAP